VSGSADESLGGLASPANEGWEGGVEISGFDGATAEGSQPAAGAHPP
jgi:hypothetical protein